MVNGTHFGTGSSGTYSVPAVGVGESLTIYGWFYFPTSPDDGTSLILGTEDQTAFYIEYVGWAGGWAGGWVIDHDWGTLFAGPSNTGGWHFVAIVYSQTSVTCYWRNVVARDLGKSSASWTYNGNAFTGKIGSFLGDAQYVGIYQGALTEAQLLAQSQSSTPIETAYSFFPLELNDGTGTVGGRNITLTSTTSASNEAPATTLPSIDITKATEFGRVARDGASFSESPFATSYTITVSAWIKISYANSYAIFLSPGNASDIGGEHLIFVVQNDNDSNEYLVNLMSLSTGDWCYGVISDIPPSIGEDWVFNAWVITSTGTSRTCQHYRKFGASDPLVATSVWSNTTTEAGWSSDMLLSVGWFEAKFYMQHLRVHTSALTLEQLEALSLSQDPDTTAWCHIPFWDTSPLDVSGNNRHATLNAEAWPVEGVVGLDPVGPALGTHFGAGSSGTYSVPAIGDGEFITLAGWFDLPTILTDDYEFVCIGAVPAPFYLERHTGGPWTLQQDYGELVKTTHTGGKVYLAIVYSKTSCVVFWRHAEHQAVGQITASGFAYNGAAFTGTIADFHGDVQCFGIWQVALTKDQVLAQSLSTSPIISAYSFFPLTANDGTGTIGGRDITLTGTVSASQQVYQTALPEIDITKSTVFDKGDYGGYIRVPYSPFSISYSITVSAWIWLGPGDHNAYVIFLGDETWDEHLLFCHQHADGSTLFETNLMSKETVDWGGSSKTATVGECEGWVFSAWVVTSSGTTRTLVKHYGQFGLSGELTDWGTITAPTCTETGWSPAMQLTVNRPSPENFRVEHVRVHIGELTQSQLAALAISDAPDTTAWVHLPLKDTSPLDVSGNDRHGDVYVEVYSAEGIEFPAPPNTGTITATAGAPTASIDGYSSATSTGIIAATAGAPTASIDGYSSATSTGIIAAIAGAPVASIDGYSEVTSTGTVDATAGAPIASAIGSISSNVGILNAVAGAPVAFIRGSTEDNVGNIVAVAGGPVANIIGYVELDDLVTACAPPVKLYTFDRSLHGVRTVLCNDGYTVALEWHKEYLNPNNWDLVYNIYWSTKQSDVYSEGVKFVFKPEVNDCYLSLNLYGYFDPGKTYYFAVKGAGHDPGTLLFDQLPSGNIPGLKTYPEAALAHDIYPIDLVIPLDDVSGFPSTGIVLIGAELISYSNVDIVNNTLIVAERGLYGYQRRIHTVDGFDGFHYYDNPFVRIFKGWEDENTAVGMIVIKFEDQYARVYQDGYGFRERVDILSGSGNLSVVDAANDGFLAYDQAGWDRTYLPDYLEGKCVGTYFGGEYGCADGNESDGSIRGLGVQDHMNMREEYLLEITGEPVMLFRRMWSGKQSQHTSATLENTTHRGLDTYGTSLVTGYNQYFNPRRSDGKILVRFGPTKEDLKREEFGIENSFIPNCWTLVTPTIKDGDFIIRFNQDGTEEWRYEIIDVDRNRTILQESGAQKFTAVRVRKTDPICQVRSILDTSTEPSEVLTSIGMVSGPGGILAHMHRIVLVNGVCLSQLTSIDQGHNHPVDENNIIGNVLNHSHTIIIP
jgi:hypothetical protein